MAEAIRMAEAAAVEQKRAAVDEASMHALNHQVYENTTDA